MSEKFGPHRRYCRGFFAARTKQKYHLEKRRSKVLSANEQGHLISFLLVCCFFFSQKGSYHMVLHISTFMHALWIFVS